MRWCIEMTAEPLAADPRTSLHSRFRLEDYGSLIDLPVDSFVGVDAAGADVLRRLRVVTIFDLAHAAVFGAAAILQAAADDPTHPFRSLGRVDPELVDGGGATLPVEEWPQQPIRLVAGLSKVLARAIKESFDLHTIGDLAWWSPYRAAVQIVRLAAGSAASAPATNEGTPADLLPANGQYPTDKVYYRSLFARHFDDTDGGIELDPSTGLDLAETLDSTSTGVGYGAYVTWEQSWYGQGLVLGNLLHSLALAPGEATMVAIVDWTREVSTSTVESVDQLESLKASTSQNRALSEVTTGVVNEIQNGFSATAAEGSTSGLGATMGGAASMSGAIPGTPFSGSMGGGFGVSGGVGHSSSTSTTVAYSSGQRESMAAYGQQVSEATQQQANSARSRRASIVQEVRESTSEQLQTRVVANYNHMHAMSVCYYEIVQIYRVVFQAARAEKCAFVPITDLDFTDDAVIQRFATILAAVSTDPYVLKVLTTPIKVSLIAAVLGATYVQLPMSRQTLPGPAGPPVGGRTSDTDIDPTTEVELPPGDADSRDWWQTGSLNVPIVIPGPIQASPSARLTFVEATAGTQDLGVILNFLDRSEGVADPHLDASLLDLRSVDVALPAASIPSQVTLEVGVSTGVVEQRYRVTMSTDTAEPGEAAARLTALTVLGGDVSASDLAMAKAQLSAEAAWYTARIWERLGTTSITALLARYRLGGRPLLTRIDPRVVAVTGTHVVFRMLLDAEQQADWARELQRWGLTGATSRREDVVPLPTGGVFAEAVLGRSNSAEILDMTRFWNWQDSPPPFAPPSIADLQAGQQSPTQPPVPGTLDAPAVHMVQPNPLPDPTGLAATLGLLGAAGIFRDMSFGGENAAAAGAAAAASSAAQIAAVSAAQQAFATAAQLAGSASVTGALMNAAKDGLPGAYEHLVPPSFIPPPGPGSPDPSPDPDPPPPAPDPTPDPDPNPDPDPTPVPDPTPDPTPPEVPETSAHREFRLRLAVASVDDQGTKTTYDWVVPDAAETLLAMVPDEIKAGLAEPIRILDAWYVNLGQDEPVDTLPEILTFLVNLATGESEFAIALAALQALIDLLGLEDVTPGSVNEKILDGVWGVVNLLQALFFPAVRGGEWLDVTIRTLVENGQGSTEMVRSATPDINYGLLSSVAKVAGWPTWAGRTKEGATALLDAKATFDPDTLQTAVASKGATGYTITISGAFPLAMDWSSVVRKHIPVLLDAVDRLYQLVAEQTGALSDWMSRAGIEKDLLAALKAGAVRWCEWWIEYVYGPLNDFLVPQVDFTFAIDITPAVIGGGWIVNTTPKHDDFPLYQLELTGPGTLGTQTLYTGPDNLASSVTGPFALAAPTTVTGLPTITSVDDASWFDPWT